MSAECTFVVTIGQDADGIAKLVDSFGSTGTIEYFDSPRGPRLESRQVPLKGLQRIELATQTRVFKLDPISGAWSVGRVDGGLVSGRALGKNEDHYHVRFPNGQDERVAISQLFVRRASPVEDPTEYLASRITDTPFFFDGRTRIVRHLADQRRLFGGLTALASSAVELLEHQVSVVRKVLSDPIQRYLLADEVGLGKTIEAGVLVRQHLLDHPDDANILVIVPDHLVLQWRRELRTKFYINAEDDRVRVISLSALRSTPPAAIQISLLVVDEAHISAEWAFSDDPVVVTGFLTIRNLAKSSPRLLLLSGTPVLYREKEFLAMLHLLDPDGYRLSDIAAFQLRISERQMVAEALVDLTDETNGMFVEEAVNRIEAAFFADNQILRLTAAVRERLWDDIADSSRVRALGALRDHIREAYKLDRRILRTRRIDPRLRDQLPNRTGATIVKCHDHARIECADFLEAWRMSIEDLGRPADAAVRLFAEFVALSLEHPRHLVQKIEERLSILASRAQASEEMVQHANSLPAFAEEQDLLAAWRTRIAFSLDEDGRAQDLVQWLKNGATRKKHIVFVTEKATADLVASIIHAGETPFEVVRYNGRAAELRVFEQAASLAILVCDRTAEEGLNLQRVGAVIIHYDLPIDAMRVEQRIGRVDRIEGRGHVSNVIMVAQTAYETAWAECVLGGVGVFDHSIAPLQFLLSTERAMLSSQLLSEGSSAFSESSRRLKDPSSGALAELKKIDAQEAIDSVEAAAGKDTAFFKRLVDADDRIAEFGKRNIDSWLVSRLGFDYHSMGPDVGRYVHNLQHTLVPTFEALKYFAESLDRGSHGHRRKDEMPFVAGTFHREVAEMHQVPLLRIGNALIDALEKFVRDDPRGMAFGIWRTLPASTKDATAFFRFDFYVQAKLETKARSDGRPYSLEALRRRADSVFPVQYETIWLDSDMQMVVDPETLEMVERTFSKDKRADGSVDVNLSHSRWQEAMQRLEVSDWPGLCDALRINAEERLKESSRYNEHQKSAMQRLLGQIDRREGIHKTRLALLDKAAANTEKQLMAVDLELNEILSSGIADPDIRVDSVGCVIIASAPLEDN